jgi:hypothetical protein
MATPLSCILPLTSDTSPAAILGALSKLNTKTTEALTRVNTVHFARFLLLDGSTPDLRPVFDGSGGPYRLAILTEYDGTFDRYIRDFAAYLSDVFGTILAHTEGWSRPTTLACEEDIAAFVEFVRSHDLAQITPNKELSMFSAYPTTVAEILAGDQNTTLRVTPYTPYS